MSVDRASLPYEAKSVRWYRSKFTPTEGQGTVAALALDAKGEPIYARTTFERRVYHAIGRRGGQMVADMLIPGPAIATQEVEPIPEAEAARLDMELVDFVHALGLQATR